jgi:hypothetical protein
MHPNSSGAVISPGQGAAPGTPLPEAPKSIPVEKLIESMQPEQPLVIDSSMTTSGYGVNQGSGSAGPTGPAPGPQ